MAEREAQLGLDSHSFVSPRTLDRAELQKWFGNLNLSLVAEHGAWIKRKKEDWYLSHRLSASWKSMVMPIMRRYAERLPGAFVEEKEFSLV